MSPDTSVLSPRLVIVGAGMSAARLLSELAERCPGRYDVTVLGAEPHQPYNRILLSPFVAGERCVEDLVLAEAQALPGVHFRLGDPVISLDRARRLAITQSGARYPYDRLVIAVGSEPIRPPLPGIDLPGVCTFRDRGDADTLIAASATATCAVVVGGGLLGLEAACGLARRGIRVTVVHLMHWLMERQLDAAAGALLLRSLAQRGIAVELGAESEAVLGGCRATGLRLKSGRILPAELIVFAIGIRPNVALAQAARLDVCRGIVVDDNMRTSDPVILAIGECVEHRGATYGLIAPLWEQAAVAAMQLAGDETRRYAGTVPATNLKVTGVELFSAGAIDSGAHGEEIVFEDAGTGVYRKLVLKEGRLAGAVLLGDARDSAWYTELMRDGTEIGARRETLVFGRDFAEPAAT